MSGLITNNTLLLISDVHSNPSFNLYSFTTDKWSKTPSPLRGINLHVFSMWFDPTNNQVFCATRVNTSQIYYASKLTLQNGKLVLRRFSKKLITPVGWAQGVTTNGFGQQLLFCAEIGRNVTALNTSTDIVETYGSAEEDKYKIYKVF